MQERPGEAPGREWYRLRLRVIGILRHPLVPRCVPRIRSNPSPRPARDSKADPAGKEVDPRDTWHTARVWQPHDPLWSLAHRVKKASMVRQSTEPQPDLAKIRDWMYGSPARTSTLATLGSERSCVSSLLGRVWASAEVVDGTGLLLQPGPFLLCGTRLSLPSAEPHLKPATASTGTVLRKTSNCRPPQLRSASDYPNAL
jgi:hypothetical protein